MLWALSSSSSPSSRLRWNSSSCVGYAALVNSLQRSSSGLRPDEPANRSGAYREPIGITGCPLSFSRSSSQQHFLYFLPLPQGQGSLRPARMACLPSDEVSRFSLLWHMVAFVDRRTGRADVVACLAALPVAAVGTLADH